MNAVDIDQSGRKEAVYHNKKRFPDNVVNVHYRKSRKIIGNFDGNSGRFTTSYNRVFNQKSLDGSPGKNPESYLNDLALRSRRRTNALDSPESVGYTATDFNTKEAKTMKERNKKQGRKRAKTVCTG